MIIHKICRPDLADKNTPECRKIWWAQWGCGCSDGRSL